MVRTQLKAYLVGCKPNKRENKSELNDGCIDKE